MDASNIYWSGNDSAGNPKMFSLARSTMSLNGTLTVTANATGAPAVADVSGTRYLFSAVNGRVYRMTTSLGSSINATPTGSNVTSYVGVYAGNAVYFGDAGGKFWSLNGSDLTTIWSYTNANSSAIGGFFFNQRPARAFYGDAAGKMYAIIRSGSTANGVVLSSNYPYQPTGVSSSDSITAAPVYVSGVTAYGTTTGKVIFLDAQNGSSQPALIQLYHVGSAVSSVAYDYQSSSVGNFMISTADGHIYVFRRDTGDNTTMIDPTSGTP
jgi:outer membrane protein assembly factor BamB